MKCSDGGVHEKWSHTIRRGEVMPQYTSIVSFIFQSDGSFNKDASLGGRGRLRCGNKPRDQHRLPFDQLREAEAAVRHLHRLLERN